MDEGSILLIVGGVLLISILITMLTSRWGVPSLVVFLLLGMLLGADGIGNIQFQNVELARFIGTIGLVAILFEGGLSTSRRRLREVALPAASLSTIGVAVTAILSGLGAKFLFDFTWLQAFLLGSVIASTDAAAVFATLRFTKIRRRLARTLEAESGGNDPAAIALTAGLIAWIQQPTYGLGDLSLLLLRELGLGLLLGLLLGGISMWAFSRLPRSVGAFAPVASLATAAVSFGVVESLGGSGFLAVYVVGLAIGSTPSRYRNQMTTFHEGLAFLAQVAMFVVLGLFVVPHELTSVAVASISIAILLMFLIRPIAVWISTFFLDFTNKERALLGWAGLRGAVPIVLGMFVLSSEIPSADVIFNTVFFVVLISALVQGTTLEQVAQSLGVLDELPKEKSKKRRSKMAKIKFEVAPHHAIVGAKIKEIGLPGDAVIIDLAREHTHLKPNPDTLIEVDDRLTVYAPREMYPEIEDVFMRWRRRV